MRGGRQVPQTKPEESEDSTSPQAKGARGPIRRPSRGTPPTLLSFSRSLPGAIRARRGKNRERLGALTRARRTTKYNGHFAARRDPKNELDNLCLSWVNIYERYILTFFEFRNR